MKARTLLFAFASSLLAPSVFAQGVPLDRAEILGRLAGGATPSFIAHLVKTHGASFAPTDSFLTQVKLAGGDGILVERLSSPDSTARRVFSGQEDRPVEHLAKCAELIHTGAIELAEAECRASIEENPASPWPLVLTAALLPRNALARTPPDPSDWDEEKKLSAEVADLQRRAALLDPQQMTTSRVEPGGVNAYMFFARNDAENSQAVSPTGGAIADMTIDAELAGDHVALASRYFAAHDFDSAQRELNEAIRLEPDNANTHTCLAFLYISGQSQNAGIAELREAVRIAPFDSERRGILSEKLEEFGRTPEAIQELKNLLAISPRDVRTSNDLVELYLKHKGQKSAIAELQRSLKATSLVYTDEAKFVEARFWDMDRLGYLLKQNREFDAAAEEYVFLLRYQPERPELHNNYGNVLMEQHRLDEAIAEYNEALRLDPEMATAHHNIGICLTQKKNLDGAIEEFRQALELNPDEPHTRVYMGIALGQQGDLNAAKDQFQQYIEKNPKDAAAHTNLGYALDQLKDTSGAIKELKTALEIQPDSVDAQNNLAWIYATADDLKLRNPAEALVLAQKAVKGSQTPNPAFLDTLAEALLLNGQPAEAFTIETQAAKLDPQNTELQSRLARFRDAASQHASAKP
jgi:tetratricopeptide (TPR) repeat protein